jgi:DNA repair protein SbcD/Mre11
MAIRVLHIGDLHLGVELYGRPDPEKGYGTRVGDFLAAFDSALALAKDADLVVLPGDIYKNCDPTPTVQREFASRIRKVARQVPVVIIPGNHDIPNAFARATSIDIFHVLEVENVYVIRKPDVITVPTQAGPVIIAALPFTPRSKLLTLEESRGKSISEVMDEMRTRLVVQLEELAGDVARVRAESGADTPAILMAHYTIRGAVFGGYGKGAALAPEVDLPLGSVKQEAWDYVALAHIHKQQSVPMNDYSGQPPVVYPGSIERVDFGEENEEKCVVLAEVARKSSTWRWVPLSTRPFVTLKLKAEDADPVGSLKEKIEERREKLQGAVVRLYYTLPPGHPNIAERELRASLEGAYYVAAIRREVPEQESRVRHGGMTTQLTPTEALEEYLKTHPELAARKEMLLDRGKALIAETLVDPVETA